MQIDPKHYFGNYPNSAEYNDNIPIGWNKWDAEEGPKDVEEDDDEDYDEEDIDDDGEDL